jgi:hypothetical protein
MRKLASACLLVAFVGCSAWAQYALDHAVYSKFIFFKDHVIYAQAEGAALRFAPTPEALVDATPIMGVPEQNGILFKDVAIPLPAEAIPEGVTVLGQFFFRPGTVTDEDGFPHPAAITHGKVWLSKTDEQGVTWTLVFRAGRGVDKNMVAELDKAPEVEVNLSQGLTLHMPVINEGADVFAGLKFSSGSLPMDSLLRNGKPAPVKVALLDADGKTVGEKAGVLRDFGYGAEDALPLVMVAPGPGEYTVKGVMEGGALGDVIAEKKITVPAPTAPAPEMAAYTIDKPIYSKLILFKDVVIYAQAEGDTMRFAPTPEALADATPIRGVYEQGGLLFQEITIPVSAEALPEEVSGVTANFLFRPRSIRDEDGGQRTVPWTFGKIWLIKTDEQGVKWSCVFRAGAGAGLNMVSNLDEAPVVEVDVPQWMSLELAALYQDGKVLSGVKFRSGNVPAENILRDGKPTALEFTVLGPDGKQIESKTGTLRDFGFSGGRPLPYAVEVAEPGEYTVKAIMRGGPFGDVEAEAKVIALGEPAPEMGADNPPAKE